VIYSSDLFTYNAKCFQPLYLARNGDHLPTVLRSMLKLRFTVHEVAWQFHNLAYSSGLMFDRVISTVAFRSLFSSNRLSTIL